MQQVKARFYLVETKRIQCYTDSGSTKEAVSAVFSAVKGEPFGTATPNGRIEMLITNTEAYKVFLDAPINTVFDVLLTRNEET